MNLFGIGTGELIFILFLALMIFGPGKLAEIASALGRSVAEFRRASREFTAEMARQMEEEEEEPEPAAVKAEEGESAPTVLAPSSPVATASPIEPSIGQATEAMPSPAASSTEPDRAEEPSPLDERAVAGPPGKSRRARTGVAKRREAAKSGRIRS